MDRTSADGWIAHLRTDCALRRERVQALSALNQRNGCRPRAHNVRDDAEKALFASAGEAERVQELPAELLKVLTAESWKSQKNHGCCTPEGC